MSKNLVTRLTPPASKENKDGKFALTSSGFHGILKNITITSNELSLDYQ